MPSDKRRRDNERRRQQRQDLRRAQRHRRRRRTLVGVSIVGALVIAAVVTLFVVTTGNDTSSTANDPSTKPTTATTSAAAPTSTSASSSSGTCRYTETPAAAANVKLPATHEPTKGTAKIAVQTNRGALTFALNRAKAPCAVGSFVSLTRQKYFDKTPCHRIVTARVFVLQCGDPTGTGQGGPGYAFGSEVTGKERYTRGVLAMANDGPNTNGSQFFIIYKNISTAALDPQYTIFGTVTSGLPIVDRVAAAGPVSGDDGKPKLPISIVKATVAN